MATKSKVATSRLRRLRIERIDLFFQPPENLLDTVVAEYVDLMRRREKTNPVLVCYDGKNYLLKDGFHRVEAALTLRRKTIQAEIIPGTRSEMEAEWQRYRAKLKETLAKRHRTIRKRKGVLTRVKI